MSHICVLDRLRFGDTAATSTVANWCPVCASWTSQSITFSDVPDLLGPAVIVALIGYMESMTIAKTVQKQNAKLDAAKRGNFKLEMDPSQELFALGMCNIAVSIFSGEPASPPPPPPPPPSVAVLRRRLLRSLRVRFCDRRLPGHRKLLPDGRQRQQRCQVSLRVHDLCGCRRRRAGAAHSSAAGPPPRTKRAIDDCPALL